MYPWQNTELRIDSKLKNFSGTLYPFQHSGAIFLSCVKRGLLLDKTGLGKTVQCLAAYDILRAQKYPQLKIVVVTLASTQLQWEAENNKFLPGIRMKAVIGKKQDRLKMYDKFRTGELDGIIVNYSQLLHDIKLLNPTAYFGFKCEGPIADAVDGQEFLLILDEIQKCKNVSAKTSKTATWLADKAIGVKGLTATPVYNHLVDLYGIFKLIDTTVFINKETFKKDFCILDYSNTPYGTIVGYKNHDKLKSRIVNYNLGRTKSEVAPDLPALSVKDYSVELPDWHKDRYEEILDGYKRTLDGNVEQIEMIGAMQRAQVCVNNIEMLEDAREGEVSHPKLDEAIRIIMEELEGEKVLVFSKFEKTISVLQKLCKENKIKVRRITGQETQLKRAEAVAEFSAPSNETFVMGITTAGGAGLNLQAAGTLIMIDRPWSGGEVDQVRGRIHRIGTKHSNLLEINIIAKDTIDEYVIGALREKAEHVEQVFGSGDQPTEDKGITGKVWKKLIRGR